MNFMPYLFASLAIIGGFDYAIDAKDNLHFALGMYFSILVAMLLLAWEQFAIERRGYNAEEN